MESFVALAILLGIGHFLRTKLRFLRRLYLPSCVIGGILGLSLLQAFMLLNISYPQSWTAPWSQLPGQLINVVFACLFLGIKLPKLSELWKRSGPQVAYGQIVAWGQYVVGIGLTIFFLGPFFGLNNLFAGILPVGFEGGHGTAAGMGPMYDSLGWPEGKDFALTSATAGIVSAVVVGMILVNWAVRNGHTQLFTSPDLVEEDDAIGIIPVDQRPVAGRLCVRSDSIEAFSLHLVVVALAILLGMGLKGFLMILEGALPLLGRFGIFTSFPLFPLCMLGGLMVQVFEDRYDRHHLVDVGLIRRIQNASLDFLVVAAIATIRIQVVMDGILPLLILVVAGIAWNVFCLMILARRLLPNAWFERAIAEMGQSMGVTATGLLLLRVVDPNYETEAADAFACKQLVHEPFMGGGLWTSIAMPLIYSMGALSVFFISCTVMSLWIIAGYILQWGRQDQRRSAT